MLPAVTLPAAHHQERAVPSVPSAAEVPGNLPELHTHTALSTLAHYACDYVYMTVRLLWL